MDKGAIGAGVVGGAKTTTEEATEARPFRATRYGDGGLKRPGRVRARPPGGEGSAAEAGAPGGAVEGRGNAAVHLTCGPHVGEVETKDPFDRAHSTFSPLGGLMPAARVVGKGSARHVSRPIASSRAREYPKHQMTSGGVAFDSSFDATRDLQEELDGIPGIGLNSGGGRTIAQAVGQALNYLEGTHGAKGIRAVARKWNTRDDL